MKKVFFSLTLLSLQALGNPTGGPEKPMTDTTVNAGKVQIAMQYSKTHWRVEPMTREDSLAAKRILGKDIFKTSQ